MDNKRSPRKRRQSSNNLLLIVLIGFCILAMIEILYGQAQMKVEKERLALAEENNQTVQELKNEWNQIKEGTSVVTKEGESEQTVGSQEENEEQPKVVEQTQDTKAEDDQAKTETEEEEDDSAELEALADAYRREAERIEVYPELLLQTASPCIEKHHTALKGYLDSANGAKEAAEEAYDRLKKVKKE